MSKEHLEQFMTQVDDSKELQAKIGKEITGEALGAAHGCEFSIEDVQASAELSDGQMEGVAGGITIDHLSGDYKMGKTAKKVSAVRSRSRWEERDG